MKVTFDDTEHNIEKNEESFDPKDEEEGGCISINVGGYPS